MELKILAASHRQIQANPLSQERESLIPSVVCMYPQCVLFVLIGLFRTHRNET